MPPTNILCAPCVETRAGGFAPDPGAVLLCSGRYFSEQHMESTIVHELMHMYDHCRFKVDWGNLRHHACSEVIGCFKNFINILIIDDTTRLDSCQQSEW